jgi:hypothetical protein
MLSFNWKDFTVHKNGTKWLFAAELSDLRVPVGKYPTKIEIMGRTGKRVTYVLASSHMDQDGDNVSWNYLPDPASLRKVPEAQLTAVKLWND